MTAFVEGALNVLDVHDVPFWEKTSNEDIERVIADFNAREQKRVQDKIDYAAKLYEDTYKDVDNITLARMAELNRLTSDSRPGSESVPESCPACKNQGEYEIYEDIDFEPDGDDVIVADHWTIDHFECPFCKLKLEHDELSYAGMEDDGDELMSEEWDEDADRDR